MGQTEYDLIQSQIREHRIGDRTESAALLAWFLRVAWRLDAEDVDDAVCDGGGDKGIDALVVNDDLREIVVFQSKHHRRADGQQGDKDIKNLFGAAQYFQSAATVDGLLASKPNEALRKLLTRQGVRDRVADGAHVTRVVFVVDGELDPAGRDYVAALEGQQPELEAFDQNRLAAIAERTVAPDLRPVDVRLKAVAPPTKTTLDGSNIAIALISGQELISSSPISTTSSYSTGTFA